jgi:DNA end-binding protein Ku
MSQNQKWQIAAQDCFERRALYENALKELIKKKQRGEKIEKPKERPPAHIVNLMDALRQSAAAEPDGAGSHPRRAATHHQRTSTNRSNTRARKVS